MPFKSAIFLLLSIFTAGLLTGCATTDKSREIRVGIAGTPEQWGRLDEALRRMGQPYRAVGTVSSDELDSVDVLILPRGAFAVDAAGSRSHNDVLTAWIENGGCLLVMSIMDKNFTRELLPHEIRFAAEDPSGWGDYDFSERIIDSSHPIFNRPHRLDYLAGLEEPSRVEYTAPGWKILLGKTGVHPSQDYLLDHPDYDVGSVFECDAGEGHVLVCQPIIDQYHAGKAEIVPHPLEQGVQLFENVVEYMKQRAAGRALPIARIKGSPTNGPAGAEARFRAMLDSGEPPSSVTWDFGDSSSGKGIEATHSYTEPGVYWATARVESGSGEVDYAACRVRTGPERQWRWADWMADAFMHRYYPDPGLVKPNYRTALVLTGLLDVYERSGDSEILEYVKGFFRKRLIERWDNRPYKGQTEPSHDFVDVYSLMTPAWRIFKFTGDSTYLHMAREVWAQSLAVDHSLPRHLLWSPFGWGGRRAIVDFTYFKCQLRAAAWEDSGDPALLDESAVQMDRFAGIFQDPTDSLFFMAIDMDHKAYFTSPERPSGLNDSKWNRADGWVSLAFSELMPRLDKNHKLYPRLHKVVNEFFTGLIHAQDPETGLWALVVDRRDYPGMWLETTGTSMYVYSICRLVEAGVLPEQPFIDCARRGYNGLQQRIGLGHWDYPYLSDACQGTLPRMNLDSWLITHRNDNDLHVIGPFLMAEEALWRLAPPDVAVIGKLKREGSLAGQILNTSGAALFQVPDLYFAPELSRFRAIVLERGALDSNTANCDSYADKLRRYVLDGGLLIAFAQQNEQRLVEIFPELEGRMGENRVRVDVGAGRVEYCRDYPVIAADMDREDRLLELKKYSILSE